MPMFAQLSLGQSLQDPKQQDTDATYHRRDMCNEIQNRIISTSIKSEKERDKMNLFSCKLCSKKIQENKWKMFNHVCEDSEI